jgi:hypothetical protein
VYLRSKVLKLNNYTIMQYTYMYCGPGSSVGIATDYGLDGPGIEFSGFGGLGVCVLASGTHDRGFAPDRSRRIFHNGKIHGTQSFGLSVFRLIPEQFQTNKVHDTSKIGPKKSSGGDEIFRIRPDRPWGSPSLLYRVFPGGKAAGAWC